MKENLHAATWRLVAFLVVCGLGGVLLFMVFGQLRFERGQSFNAEFTNVSGLEKGDFVRIAGAEVGKVDGVTVEDTVVRVRFNTDTSVVLTQGTRAVIRYDDLIGGRYLELEEGAGGTSVLEPGDTLPISNTQPALDLDALIGGFRPLLRAIEPDQMNALTGQLIRAFQDQGEAIGSFLAQTGAVTSTLADRDQLIGEVIQNLNVVLGTLGDQSEQFGKAVDSLSELMHGLAERKEDITNGLAYAESAAASIADLLEESRPPLRKVVSETDRSAGIAVADHEYLDNLLLTLPDLYQALNRQATTGDFFSFYLCDAVLKLNGKGGQPVYVKVAGQDTGRCAPK